MSRTLNLALLIGDFFGIANAYCFISALWAGGWNILLGLFNLAVVFALARNNVRHKKRLDELEK